MTLTLAAALLLSAADTGNAQQQQPPVFRSEAGMVLVDVIVKDGDGRFVQGLTKEDFVVYEDGRPVDISFFALERFRDELPPTTTIMDREGYTQVDVEQSPVLPRYLVVFIDAFNTSPGDWSRLREPLIEYLRQGTRANDRVLLAVLTPERRLLVAPEFTGDPEAVVPVLENLRANTMIHERDRAHEQQIHQVLFEDLATGAALSVDAAGGDAAAEANRLRHGASLAHAFAGERKEEVVYTLDSLNSLAGHLDRSFPVAGPKVMLLVSSGIPLRPGNNYFYMVSERFEQGVLGARQQGGVEGRDPIAFRSQYADTIQQYLRRTIGKLNRQNYVVYTISTRGPGDLDRLTGITHQGRSNLSPTIQSIIHRDQQEGLGAVAADTGGLAFMNSFDFGQAFARIDDDTALRYVLGYTPPAREDGAAADEFYEIRVEGKVAGLNIRARRGYVDG